MFESTFWQLGRTPLKGTGLIVHSIVKLYYNLCFDLDICITEKKYYTLV